MAGVLGQLKQIESGAGNKLDEYKKVIDSSSQSQNVEELKAIVNFLANDQVSMSDSKPALSYLTTKLEGFKNATVRELSTHAVGALAPRQNLFSKEDAAFRRECAEVMEAQQDLEDAIRMLQGVKYDENDKDCKSDRAADFLSIAEYQFENDDATAAEMYANKVAHFIHEIDSKELQLRYQRAHVQILDSKREFQLAAQGYYRLSTTEEVDKEEALDLFNQCMTAALLAPQGPRKSRMLTTLYKDERVKSNQFHDLLQKFFKGEVIKHEHVKEFEDSLQAHQNIKYSDGYTVLSKALIEHNIEVISKIYMNISFSEMASFLGIKPAQAEQIISKMVREQRISATLDQENQIVEFEDENKQLMTFNGQIKQVCENVDSLIQDILKVQPELQKYDKHIF